MRYLVLILSISLYACHCTQKASDKAAVKNVEQTLEAKAIPRFSVSFISTGAGIDRNAKEALTAYLKSYEEQYKVKLIYDLVPWGREGEQDFCFDLVELDTQQQKAFIEEVKERLKAYERIRYYENQACRKAK